MEREEYRRMAAAEAAHWWYAATRELLRLFLRPYLRPGLRVLDAGCGTGAAGGWLAGEGRPVGVDVEPYALRLYREAHPGVPLAAASVARLPFPPATFDLALCVTVLYHEGVADPGAALRELARVVRPGGIVCAMEPGLPRLRRAHDRVTHAARRFSRADLHALFAAAGLEARRVSGAYSFLAVPAAVKSLVERGRSASDLDAGRGGFGGVFPGLARLERRWLERRDLPLGLSVIGIGVRAERGREPGGVDGPARSGPSSPP